MKFYYCAHCKNVVIKISDKGVPLLCCGEVMESLLANNVDAAFEKHVPVITKPSDNLAIVKVGDVLHPMVNEHYIEFIVLEKETGFEIKYLNPGENPEVTFNVTEDILNVYAYCNLHGLWKN